MIIPIGNTGSLRRIPYITLSLILINIIIFFITYPKLLRDYKRIGNAYYKYVYKIYEYYIQEEHFNNNDLSNMIMDFSNIPFDSLNIDENSDYYNEIKALKERFDKSKEDFILNKLGVSKKHHSFMNFLSSIFMHGGIMHLIGNMWFLILLGANVEDTYGRLNFLIFYILSGFISAAIFLLSIEDPNLSLVGASGAIAGIMGVFMVRHFKEKIQFFYFFFPIRPLFGTFKIIAGFVLPLWFIMQIIDANSESGSGVAFMAHVGGFLFGVIVAYILSLFKIEEKYIAPKIEESANLLGISKKEERGLNDYYNEKYNEAIILLEEQFHNKLNEVCFIPLFDSYIKTGEIKKAENIAQLFFNNYLNKGNNILSIYDEIKEKKLFNALNIKTKFLLLKYFHKNNKIEETRELVEDIVKNNKYTIIASKVLLFAIENNIDFIGIDEMKNDYINNMNNDNYVIIEKIKGVIYDK